MVFEDHLTYSLLLVLINGFTKNCKPFFIISKSFCHLFCHFINIFLSCLLIISKYCFLHLFWSNNLFHCLKHFSRNSTAYICMLFFTYFCNYFIDKFNNCLINIMSHIYSFNHLCFRNLICTSFNHDNFLLRRCYSKLKVTILPL